jgi:TolA-binding protein
MAQSNEDPWLKRNWNNMVARFNIYFNATQKLDAAVDNLATKQLDDFNEVIAIYPYGTADDAKNMRAPMEEAMKKASKVIQNKPRSKWADNAYFLIGQTQFFSGDYYASIETFQFVNNAYTDETIKAMSQLWLMKSYIQQEKLDDAEAIYGLLTKIQITDNEFNTGLNLSAGDLMVKQGKNAIAIRLLQKGLNKLKDRTLRYRTNFVLGQLYLEQKKYRKANEHFIKVLRMNAPYEYVFQANLGMAKSTSEAGGQGAQKTKKYLKRMLEDDKNIEYYNQIYYELAKLEFATDNTNQGLIYMKKSASTKGSNTTQLTKTCLFLADYYFKSRKYDKAQSYYDSSVAIIPEDYPNVDNIKTKHSILSKLIENIETVRTQDSLLALSTMDRELLDRKIDDLIEQEKEATRIAKEDEIIRKEQAQINARNPGNGGGINTTTGGGSTWYFYNSSTVARGTNDFERTWGNRKHDNFWRFLNKNAMSNALSSKSDDTQEEKSDPDTYSSSKDKEQEELLKDVASGKLDYYKDIPFSSTAQLVAKRKIQAAYLGTGKIYFDELKEYVQSTTNFTTLLNKYPATLHKPEALFYLAKNATKLGDSAAAASYAKMVADEFPETAFNSVLNNKEIIEDNSDDEVIALYERMFTAFKNEKFDTVFTIKKTIDKEYAGNSIQAKIDYLYALTIGHTSGKKAYISELEGIKEAYSGTAIGERAAYTIRLLTAEDKLADDELSRFTSNLNGVHYYVITGNTANSPKVELDLGDYNNKFFGTIPLQITSLVFEKKQLYYIKQFDSKATAIKYHKEMEASASFLKQIGLKNANFYAITPENFRILVKLKDDDEYIRFFAEKYK